jgi:hypothetical protein
MKPILEDETFAERPRQRPRLGRRILEFHLEEGKEIVR